MRHSCRRAWQRGLMIVALISAALWAGPGHAMNVTLTVSPTGQVCDGGSAYLAAQVTNLPAGTQHLLYHFTINRPDNSFEENWAWSALPYITWTPRAGAAMRGPFTLWVVVNAIGPGNQVIASAFASISGYRVVTCQSQALSVQLYPKPPGTVKIHCEVSLYATPTPHTPPTGERHEYYFYVQDSNFNTVPGGCARSTNRLCTWHPAQLGTFRIGVQAYRVTPGTGAILESATKEIGGYVVAPTGPCP